MEVTPEDIRWFLKSGLAMWQVIPDPRKEAMRDMETRVVMPTIVEYLNIVKRRRLSTFAIEHDASMHHQLRPPHNALVAQMLPNPDMLSSSPSDFSVADFLQGPQCDTITWSRPKEGDR